MSGVSIVRTFLDAIERGDLPASTRVELSGRGYVLVVMPGFGPVDFGANERAGEYVRGLFPGGDVKRGHCAVRWDRKTRPVDQLDYHVKTPDGTLVQFWYYAPHIHQPHHWRGEVTRGGTPSWRCGACRKPITKTEARALGLLPVKGK